MTETTTTKAWSLRDVIQVVSPVTFATLGLCFALGLLIINLRLATFGVFDGGFLRTEYVLTGALFLFLVVQAGVSFHYSLTRVVDGRDLWRKGNKIKGFALIGLTIFAYTGTQSYALGILSQHQLGFLNWKTWLVLAILLGAAVQVRVLFGDSYGVCKQFFHSVENDRVSEFSGQLNDLAFSLLFVLVFIAMYAQYAFPKLSPAFGGGLKDHVILLPTERGVEVIKALGLPARKDQKTFGPFEILTESDKEIVIISDDIKKESVTIHAIRINRSLLDAVLNVGLEKLSAQEVADKDAKKSTTPVIGKSKAPGPN